MEQERKNKEIPFVKPARIGNFKMWRTKTSIGKGKEKTVVEQINVSTLDGGWHIKIPETFDMFSMISGLYADMMGGSSSRKNQIVAIISNMLYSSCIANGFFQQAVTICASIYANPSLLNEGNEDHEAMMTDVRALIEGFREWKKAYGETEKEPTEKELDAESKAEEMAEILAKDEDGQSG